MLRHELKGRAISAACMAVCLALLAAAVPAQASALPDQGDHGAQARCMFRTAEVTTNRTGIRLVRINVLPPTLFAPAGSTTVGWRLIVQRAYENEALKRIFTSVLQRSPATATQPGGLRPLSARVNSPLFVPDGHGSYRTSIYRAVLEFYWFDASNGLVAKERHIVGNYDSFRDGSFLWTENGDCEHAWIFVS